MIWKPPNSQYSPPQIFNTRPLMKIPHLQKIPHLEKINPHEPFTQPSGQKHVNISTHPTIKAYFHYKHYCSQSSDFAGTFENFTVHYAVKETILYLKHIVQSAYFHDSTRKMDRQYFLQTVVTWWGHGLSADENMESSSLLLPSSTRPNCQGVNEEGGIEEAKLQKT